MCSKLEDQNRCVFRVGLRDHKFEEQIAEIFVAP
jgi:hypothetical protein